MARAGYDCLSGRFERDFDALASAPDVAAAQTNGTDFAGALRVRAAAGHLAHAVDAPEPPLGRFVRKGAFDRPVLFDESVDAGGRIGKNGRYGTFPQKIDAGLVGRNVRADLLGRAVPREHRPQNEFGREVKPKEDEAAGSVDFDRNGVSRLQTVSGGKRIENFGSDFPGVEHFLAADRAAVGFLTARKREEDRFPERDDITLNVRHRRGERGSVGIVPEELFDGHDEGTQVRE